MRTFFTRTLGTVAALALFGAVPVSHAIADSGMRINSNQELTFSSKPMPWTTWTPEQISSRDASEVQIG